MFYKVGVDITNDRQMFNFLKEHFDYYIMNTWNIAKSVANNVKLYNLDLPGDWTVAMDLLNAGEYEVVNDMISDWEDVHPCYEVSFNGRSGGYLVLCNSNDHHNVLPEYITDNDTYEEYKQWCRDEYGSVKANRAMLVEYTKLVQSFDRLCDHLRAYCSYLSKQTFEILEMQRAVEEFNDCYTSDLEYLEFQYLKASDDGIVDLSEIINLQSLTEAFMRVASRAEEGYVFEWLEDCKIRLKKK